MIRGAAANWRFRHGPAHRGPQGHRLRFVARPGHGVRDLACARRREGVHQRAHRRQVARHRGRDRARHRRGGRSRGRGHHDGGRPRQAGRRLPRRGHPHQQQRRPEARQVRGLGPRRLHLGVRAEHAARGAPDPRADAGHAAAQVRPHREHHVGHGEVAARAPGPVDGGTHSADGAVQGDLDGIGRRQRHDQQRAARAHRLAAAAVPDRARSADEQHLPGSRARQAHRHDRRQALRAPRGIRRHGGLPVQRAGLVHLRAEHPSGRRLVPRDRLRPHCGPEDRP